MENYQEKGRNARNAEPASSWRSMPTGGAAVDAAILNSKNNVKTFKPFLYKVNMIIAEFAIFPTSEGISVSKYVKRAIEAIKSTGLNYEVGAMSTVIEGENIDEIFDAVKKAYDAIISMGAKRIHIDLRIDHRLDKEETMEYKKRAVK